MSRRKLTFDVREHHAEFGLFKDHESFPSSFAYCGCDVLLSNNTMKVVDACSNDPHEINYVSAEGHGLDCAMVDLVDSLPSSIVKDKLYGFLLGLFK